jgi:hypothetical protein
MSMKTYRLYWSPEGKHITNVRAKNEMEAIRKAPKPYKEYLGEIYAEEIKVKRTNINTPYKAGLHLAALKATGAKLTQPNAYGDSPNNSNWASFDMFGETRSKFQRVCEEFGLYCSWYGVAGYTPHEGSTMVVAKYERHTDVPEELT